MPGQRQAKNKYTNKKNGYLLSVSSTIRLIVNNAKELL
jgi:hypothetical protein